MLPDISKRRRLWGLDRKKYDDSQLHAIIDMKNNDGCTTNNCVPIVQRMNVYLDESRGLIVEASAIFYFMLDLVKGKYAESESVVIQMYDENIDKGLLGASLKNMMRMIKSLSRQRKLCKKVKHVIKCNKLSGDWAELLNNFMDDLDKRLMYIREVPIPANLVNTPMGAYVDYLGMMGMTVSEDIRLFMNTSGDIFDNDDQSVKLYKDHVMGILCSLDGGMAQTLVDKARPGMDARRRRIENGVAADEANKAAETAASLEECRETVLSMCSAAGGKFRRMRRNGLMILAKNHADVYVVAAATVKPKRIGYLSRCGKGKFNVSRVDRASFFKTEEEARQAVQVFQDGGENRVAEIAKIELLSYGFGI